jgi:hypothetical protein
MRLTYQAPLIGAAAVIGAVAAAQTAPAVAPPPAQSLSTWEEGVARPGGVYATPQADDPQACRQACADDALCMSWTFRLEPAPACELKAVIPAPVEDTRAISGLAARAPDFARLVTPQRLGEPTVIVPLPSLAATEDRVALAAAPSFAPLSRGPAPASAPGLAGVPALPPQLPITGGLEADAPVALMGAPEPTAARQADLDPIRLNAAVEPLPLRGTSAEPGG